MDGDLTPLREVCDIAERHGAVGDRGRSARDRAVRRARVGSRRRARACAIVCWRRCTPAARRSGRGGAWVAGSRALRDVMVNRARSFIFSTAPLPVLGAALGAGARSGRARAGAPQAKCTESRRCCGARWPMRASHGRRRVADRADHRGLERGRAGAAVGADGGRIRRARDPPAVGGAGHGAAARHRALSRRRRGPHAVRSRGNSPAEFTLLVKTGSDPVSDRSPDDIDGGMRSTCGIRSPRCRSTSPPSRLSWSSCRGQLSHRRSRPAAVRRHLGALVQSAGPSRAGNRRSGHRAARAVRAHDAARHHASGRRRAGAAAGRDRPAGLNHVFFSDNGATAVESALKIAFQYRLLTQGKEAAQRRGVSEPGQRLSRRHAGRRRRRRRRAVPRHLQADPAAVAENAVAVLLSLSDRQDAGGLLDRLRRRARSGAGASATGRVCAVILEPGVQAAAGMLTLPAGISLARGRGVPQARRAADPRRGGDRFRPHRDDVRVSARRGDAGSAVRREGADRRLSSRRGDARHRPRSTTRFSGATTSTAIFFTATPTPETRSAVRRRSRQSACCRTGRSSAASNRKRACFATHSRRSRRIGTSATSARPV